MCESFSSAWYLVIKQEGICSSKNKAPQWTPPQGILRPHPGEVPRLHSMLPPLGSLGSTASSEAILLGEKGCASKSRLTFYLPAPSLTLDEMLMHK